MWEIIATVLVIATGEVGTLKYSDHRTFPTHDVCFSHADEAFQDAGDNAVAQGRKPPFEISVECKEVELGNPV